MKASTITFLGLKNILHARLYGQHIAERIVLDAITSHVRKSKSRKPLVMTFHGSNGVGKTYVSRIIAKAFYEKGESSRYFHFYYGLDNFPLSEKISEYQVDLTYAYVLFTLHFYNTKPLIY